MILSRLNNPAAGFPPHSFALECRREKKNPYFLRFARCQRISTHSCGVPRAGECESASRRLHVGSCMKEEQKAVDSFNYGVSWSKETRRSSGGGRPALRAPRPPRNYRLAGGAGRKCTGSNPTTACRRRSDGKLEEDDFNLYETCEVYESRREKSEEEEKKK